MQMGRASAWQLWCMSEALPSAMYALKLPDAGWPARVLGMSKLSGTDTTTWSPVPKLDFFQDVMVNFLAANMDASFWFAVSQTREGKPESRLSPADLAALMALSLVISVSRKLTLPDRAALASSRASIRTYSCSTSFCLRFLQAAACYTSHTVYRTFLAPVPNLQLLMNRLTETELLSVGSTQAGALCLRVRSRFGPG